MDIGRVDTVAVRGTSGLHRTSPVAKLIGFALVLSAVIVSANLLVVASVALVLLSAGLAARLPMRLLLGMAAYPGVFAALYALAAAPDILTGLLLVTKAVTAALAALTLMLTTPYPQVIAPMQALLPSVLADALLMTYRSLFLLMERFSHVMTAARLRAGIFGRQPVRSAQNVTRSLAGVLLYSIDLSQRTYDVMHLRGYDGRLVVTQRKSDKPLMSASVVAGAGAMAAACIVWRVGGAALAPYAWLPLGVAAAILMIGVTLRVLPRKGEL